MNLTNDEIYKIKQVLHLFKRTNALDVLVQGDNITLTRNACGQTTISSSGGGGTGGGEISIIDITYEDLYELYSNSQLVPLQYYKITDFQTIYNQTGTGDLKESSVEELIVQASSAVSLFPNAISVEFPTDEIVYDITYTNTYLTSDPAKGKIIFRKNLNGVSAPFDFRKVLMYDARSTSENLFYKNPDVSDVASDIASYPSTMSSIFSVEFPASSIGGITSQTSNNFYYDTRVSGDLNQSSSNIFVNNSFTNVDQVSSSSFFESVFTGDVIQVSNSIITRATFGNHVSQMVNMQIEDCTIADSSDYCTSSSWANTTFGEKVNAVIGSNFNNSSIGDRVGSLIGGFVLSSNIGKRLFWCTNLALFNSDIDGNFEGVNQLTWSNTDANCDVLYINGLTMFNNKYGLEDCTITGNSIASAFGNITFNCYVINKTIDETTHPFLFNQSVHKTIYQKPNGEYWYHYIDNSNTITYTQIV